MLMLSLMNQNFKGIVYIIGATFALIVGHIAQSLFKSNDNSDPNKICDVIALPLLGNNNIPCSSSLFILFTLFFAPTHADCAVRAPRVSLSPLRALYSTTDGGRKQAPCGMSTTTAETACAGQGTPVTTTHTTARDNTDRRHAHTVQGSLTTTT